MSQLPDLVRLEDCNGDWQKYEDALYTFFRADFVDSVPRLRGLKVVLGRQNLFKGKERIFWHIISEGDIEADRLPNLRRSERIRWIRCIIENASDADVKVWENQRGRDTRVCLCCGDWEYLIVLIKRPTHLLLLTAYPIEHDSTKRKLQKEYDEYTAKPAQ